MVAPRPLGPKAVRDVTFLRATGPMSQVWDRAFPLANGLTDDLITCMRRIAMLAASLVIVDVRADGQG